MDGGITGLLVMIGVFAIGREFVCWYLKTNEQLAVLREIRDLLKSNKEIEITTKHIYEEINKQKQSVPPTEVESSSPKKRDFIRSDSSFQYCPKCSQIHKLDTAVCKWCGTDLKERETEET